MPYTLAQHSQLTEEIKKSRFVVNALPVECVEQAKSFIESVSDTEATHNCWAWKIDEQYRFSDDGEPTSTAGKPILAAIEGQDYNQVVVVVTRYFGGIKLGTGGLIRAYGGTANRCLQQALRVELVKKMSITFHCYYSEWPIIENQLAKLHGIIEKQEFDESGVISTLLMPKDTLVTFQHFLTNITRGRIIFR